MLLTCKTNHAVILVGGKFERGLWRFLDAGQPLTPGVPFAVEPLRPINEQIMTAARLADSGLEGLAIHIDQSFTEILTPSVGLEVTLFIGNLPSQRGDEAFTRPWRTMPELLRAMPKSRARLAYLKAWQVFSGAASEEISAVEFNDLGEIQKFMPPPDSN